MWTLVIFLLFDILPIGGWFGFTDFQPVNNKESLVKIQQKDVIATKALPDIYYIILDAYARSDIFQEMYHFENQEFIDFLKERGFFVAEKSRTNYPQTALSVASSLNFHYIDQLLKIRDIDSDDRSPLADLIRGNQVFSLLKKNGYTTTTFSSGKSETEIKDADRYLSPRWSFSEFQNLLINSTPLPLILRRLQYQLHRKRILFILNHLGNLSVKNHPVFVFAHILAPHPPFVFGESGQPVQPNRNFSYGDGPHFLQNASRLEYVEGYKKEVLFLNEKLKEAIRTILSNSPIPPLIILQSDHGPGSRLDWSHMENTDFRERMSNFLACYLPDTEKKIFYQSITPVNLFRIILNHYFDANYDLLKDKCYFSSLYHPYNLTNVTEKVD